MPNLRTQDQLAADLAEWQRQDAIARVAADNGDIRMFQEAQDRIHEIEEKNRRMA